MTAHVTHVAGKVGFAASHALRAEGSSAQQELGSPNRAHDCPHMQPELRDISVRDVIRLLGKRADSTVRNDALCLISST